MGFLEKVHLSLKHHNQGHEMNNLYKNVEMWMGI